MIDYSEAPGEWGMLAKSWRKALMSDNKSRNTIRIYLHAVRQLGLWAYRQPKPPEPTTITTAEVRDYMADVLARTSPANAHNHYRSLRTFFVFLMEEEEIDRSPMDRVKAPMVPDKPIPIVTLETMSALLDTCKGKTFVDRRDTAILRVLWDTGGRRAEISNLALTALDLDTDGIQVTGKGRRTRYIPIGSKTSLALTRYLRVRSLHPQAALPALWLGSTGQGALTHPGIKAMLERRCREAGRLSRAPRVRPRTAATLVRWSGPRRRPGRIRVGAGTTHRRPRLPLPRRPGDGPRRPRSKASAGGRRRWSGFRSWLPHTLSPRRRARAVAWARSSAALAP